MMRAILGSAVVLVVASGAVALGGQGKIDPKKLIGRWELVAEQPVKKKDGKDDAKTPAKSSLPPTVIEFTPQGTLILSVGEPGREYRVNGTFRSESDKLAVTLKLPEREVQETLTIVKLTDDELVTKDSKNQVETLRRKR